MRTWLVFLVVALAALGSSGAYIPDDRFMCDQDRQCNIMEAFFYVWWPRIKSKRDVCVCVRVCVCVCRGSREPPKRVKECRPRLSEWSRFCPVSWRQTSGPCRFGRDGRWEELRTSDTEESTFRAISLFFSGQGPLCATECCVRDGYMGDCSEW